MTADDESAVDRQRHPAFGRVRYAHENPDALLGPGSLAATNLHEKLLRALARGDDEKADALVRRLVALPVEPRLELAPALWIGQQTLFEEITDDMEDCAEGDDAWLDAVLPVLASASPFGRRVIAGALVAIVQDVPLARLERRRIAQALDGSDALPWDPYEDAGMHDPAFVVREVAALLLAYRSA